MGALKIGILGYGLAGRVFHAPLISSVAALQLTAIATSRVDEVARDCPGVRAVTSDELLRDASLNAIVIASPTASHFALAKAALLAGKHVVVDKPIATNHAEADELIALAQREKRLLTVFQNRRWDGDFLTVQRLIREGALGNVSYYEAHFDRFRPRIKAGWREDAGPGTGVLFDLGSHLIDQALCLFGLPDALNADIVAQRPDAKVEDYFHLTLHYGTRRAVLHCTTLAAGPGYRYLVHGDAGSFRKSGMDGQEDALKAGVRPCDAEYGLDENPGERIAADGACAKVPTERGCYQMFYQLLAEALQTGGTPPVNPRDSSNVLRIIEAARQSATQQKMIAV